jgi:hypothetical protein
MKKFIKVLIERKIQVSIATLLILALANLPYGYYQFLRIAVFVSASVLAWRISKAEGMVTWIFVMAGLALLFNPIFIIHFQRDEWAWIDVVSALVFLDCPQANGKG